MRRGVDPVHSSNKDSKYGLSSVLGPVLAYWLENRFRSRCILTL